jgi:tetratricopeptide (TPR) repeat protein
VLDFQAEQYEHGQAYQDLYEAVGELKRRHDLHPCAVRARDGLALRRDSEREIVQDLVKRFRSLPPDQQRRLPALLNSLAQLEIVVGDLEPGQHDFEEVARLVVDPISRAEAYHNVYRAALERQDWHEAFTSLRQAVALDPEAFQPFPFDRFDPLRILGAGAFGVTFLCRDRSASAAPGLPVVVRSVRSDSLDRDVGVLFRELATIRDLDHPALVRVREFGHVDLDSGHSPYVVTEYFEGQTLAEQVAEQGPLSPEDWLGLAWPIARALQALHNRGVLHRSLRPNAVLVRWDDSNGGRWRVKLLDAGFSLRRSAIHAATSHPAAREQTGLGRSVARAVPYLAQEVVGKPKGQVWVGPHSDIYSLGRLSAFALTGKADPEAADKVLLTEDWSALLAACTTWTQAARLSHVGLVLERLNGLSGPGGPTDQAEKTLYEGDIADLTAALERNPEDVNVLGLRANAHFRQGEFALAVADYSRAIELRPQDAALLRRRALAHVRVRDLEEAVEDYTRSLTLEPRDVEALANRGLAYAQLERWEEAIADYTEAIHHNPRDEALLYNRGNAYYWNADLSRAIVDFTDVIRLDPRHVWALGNRGRCHLRRGEFARAVADFNRVLQLEPINVRALCDRAQAHQEQNSYDLAISDFNRALQLEPSAALTTDRGLCHASRGDLAAAVADFGEALDQDPRHAPAWMFRGTAHADLGQLDKALADFTEAIRLSPQAAVAYYRRGLVHVRKGDRTAARADFSKALELDPTHNGALFQRGNLWAEEGDHDRAIVDYTAALEIDPRDNASLTNRGNSFFHLLELTRAQADYNAALEIEPADVLTLLNRANMHARNSDLEKALADASTAATLEPSNARVRASRATLHLERGDREAALADFEAAVKIDPAFARAHLGRADLLADRGDDAAALAAYGDAIRADDAAVAPWFGRGCLHTGDDAAALADFDEVLQRQPGHAGALNNRGTIRRRRGEYEAALFDFTAALEADASFVAAWFNRAGANADAGHLDAAVADYTACLRLQPDDLAALTNRARLLHGLGRYEEALADNRAVVQLAPADIRGTNNLAWLLATCPREDLRDPVRSVELATTAVEATGGQDPQSLDTLAASLAAAGRLEEATAQQRRALELAADEDKPDYQTRLALYEAGQPFRESAPPAA